MSEDHASLRAGLRGELIQPGDASYDDARKLYNAMIDKKPRLIARCVDVADVRACLDYARRNSLLLAIRGGGHNGPGLGSCDDGLVIDLSRMRGVRVDPVTSTAQVAGGCVWGDVDHATHTFGMAATSGIISTTGVGGLTLGGGIGHLSRRYGLSIDNLLQADVVLADGTLVTASQEQNEDLFWALRGGGGNFGVVTRFAFRLHPVGPDVLSGLIVYPIADAKAVLQQYRDFVGRAPDDLAVWAVLRPAPPLPFLPPAVHGQGIVALAVLYAGDPHQGEPLLAPLRTFGAPLGAHVGVQPYVAWQQTFDPLLAAGARNYWKSHNFSRLDDRLFDLVGQYVAQLPSPQCEIFFGALGGATARPAPESTASPHRDALFVMNFHGRWADPADDDRCIGWARDFFTASAPFASGGAYVNFLTADEGDRVRAAYGPNYPRLAQVKRKNDPDNLFRMNQNIQPAGENTMRLTVQRTALSRRR